jgi:hypothetical protein
MIGFMVEWIGWQELATQLHPNGDKHQPYSINRLSQACKSDDPAAAVAGLVID